MNTTEKYIPLLQILQAEGSPMGASAICRGIDASQATVGRQLHWLEAHGLIEKVSNKGRVLTDKGRAALAQHSANHQRSAIASELAGLSVSDSKASLLEIVSIRALLEPHAAACAARLAQPADIEELENLAFAHRYMLSRKLPSNAEDLHFHLAISRICQNRALYKLLELLLTDNNAYVHFSRAGETGRREQVAGHFAVLDAIRSRDEDASRRAMIEHLQYVYESVERHYAPADA